MNMELESHRQELTEAEQKVLQGLGEDLIPLYYVVKLNYYVSALGQQDTTVRDFITPAIRPLLKNLWARASKKDRYFAIQAYYAFLEKTAEITGVEPVYPDAKEE